MTLQMTLEDSVRENDRRRAANRPSTTANATRPLAQMTLGEMVRAQRTMRGRLETAERTAASHPTEARRDGAGRAHVTGTSGEGQDDAYRRTFVRRELEPLLSAMELGFMMEGLGVMEKGRERPEQRLQTDRAFSTEHWEDVLPQWRPQKDSCEMIFTKRWSPP
ncbi:uncharacterized protein DSM5745_03962 [Aspergillus mulundensis]|uniref:Uncharacterized protein n=1 Tax=Aspergillus mulundensis TaxID=1810919 RepID=A0A3D8SBE4_9EURO|nr:hypothetical protein DSM5745_03962 [Aspergillus mulundensis]RDW83636.1 hypothetical protein DSM5745_03962 [Aspergillus mulundensis]